MDSLPTHFQPLELKDSPLPDVVDFREVTKRFGDKLVLDKITFKVADIPNKGELVAALSDLAAALRPIRARLFDLLPIVRKHFYHPAFHGSFSIKAVLPALVPTMTYNGMAIADGGTAAVKFAKMARGHYSLGECAVIRRDLLTYCGQDTLAMVEVHRALLQQC